MIIKTITFTQIDRYTIIYYSLQYIYFERNTINIKHWIIKIEVRDNCNSINNSEITLRISSAVYIHTNGYVKHMFKRDNCKIINCRGVGRTAVTEG